MVRRCRLQLHLKRAPGARRGRMPMTTKLMAAFCCVIATVSVLAQVPAPASEELAGTEGTGAAGDSPRHACEEARVSSRAKLIAAIPRPTVTADADGTFVRVKCTSGGPSCAVFLECRDQERDTYCFFAELDAIEDQGAIRLSRSDLADALGVPDWPERLSCNLLSSDSVTVQVLVRSISIPIHQAPQAPPWTTGPDTSEAPGVPGGEMRWPRPRG